MKKFHKVILVIWIVAFILLLFSLYGISSSNSPFAGPAFLACYLIVCGFTSIINGLITGLSAKNEIKKDVSTSIIIHLTFFLLISIISLITFTPLESKSGEAILYLLSAISTIAIMSGLAYLGYFIKKRFTKEL